VDLVRARTIPTERRQSAKLVPMFADRGCHMVSATDPCSRILAFSRPEALVFVPISSSIVFMRLSGPVPDPLLLIKSGSTGNRTRDLWNCSTENSERRITIFNVRSSVFSQNSKPCKHFQAKFTLVRLLSCMSTVMNYYITTI
jgi:hypothetical protein